VKRHKYVCSKYAASYAHLHGCNELEYSINKTNKKRMSPATGCGGLRGCEMLVILHRVDNRLTDGGEVVSLSHRPRSTPQKRVSASGTHFS
jgi:hypothetical protein